MSLPPQTIQIKRKRGDDDNPVSFLRVESNKRHRSDAYVYQRKETVQAEPPRDTIPVIQTWQPRKKKEEEKEETRVGKKAAAPKKPGSEPEPQNDTARARQKKPAQPGTRISRDLPAADQEPRRFHFKRQAASAGISKRSRAPTVFVEKHKRLKIARDVTGQLAVAGRQRHQQHQQQRQQPAEPSAACIPLQQAAVAAAAAAAAAAPEQHQGRRLKKPGLAKRSVSSSRERTPDGLGVGGVGGGGGSTRGEGDGRYTAPLPESFYRRHLGADEDELVRQMNDWTLDQIGLNFERIDAEAAAAAVPPPSRPHPSSKSPLSGLKPKPPAQRYFERHPEVVVHAPDEEEEEVEVDEAGAQDRDVQMQGDDFDEDDYITETYVRVPAIKVESIMSPAEVGLLVFDNEPDVEFFYGDESDSDDEWAEDDEDENAENHYTADYPEDEVDSDDEFDRDPYHFRTGNASDMEEFDDAGYVVSGGEEADERQGYRLGKTTSSRVWERT